MNQEQAFSALKLIADLYSNITTLQNQIFELQKQLDEKKAEVPLKTVK
jgi:hypothetical protein